MPGSGHEPGLKGPRICIRREETGLDKCQGEGKLQELSFNVCSYNMVSYNMLHVQEIGPATICSELRAGLICSESGSAKKGVKQGQSNMPCLNYFS